MHMRHLQYFVVVADELHFGKAATRLHVSQPALTQQIRHLERLVGAELFQRTTRRVELTPAGHAFLRHVERALDEIERGTQAAARADAGEIGRLSIGFAGSTTYELLPRLTQVFRSRYPEVNLEIHNEMFSPAQVTALLEGRIDMGFLRPPVSAPALTLEHIRDEPLIAVVPEQNRLATAGVIELSQLADEPFLLYPTGASTTVAVMAACDAAGFAPAVAQEATETHTLVSLVAAGLGVTLLPNPVRHLRVPGVVYVPLAPPEPLLELCVAWRTNDDSAVLPRFLEITREYRDNPS